MIENVLRWPMMGGSFLEVIGCLRAALMDLLGGVMDFNTTDGFGRFLEAGLILVLMNVKGFGGAGALRELIDSNRSFPVMSTFSIVLVALEIFQHMLDFRSSVACFGFGQQTCGWAVCMTTFATNLVSCSAEKVNVLFVFGCGRVFWHTGTVYVFWLLTTCCLNACFLYSGHSLYDATCGPYNWHTLVFLLLYLGILLREWFSLQIRRFCLDLQFLAEQPKLWQLKHCLTKTGDRNSHNYAGYLQTKF